MHTQPEAELLAELAAGRRTAVEIGVYEGSSALVLAASLPVDAVLHLIDPFVDSRGLAAGWRGSAWATRRVVDRAVRRRGGPTLRWHVERSEETGRRWAAPVDLVVRRRRPLAPRPADSTGSCSARGCRRAGSSCSTTRGRAKPGGEGLPGDGGVPGPTVLVDRLFRGADAIAGWRIRAELHTTVAVERVS